MTTITGRGETGREHTMWHSRGSSQERLASRDNITKHVTVEYDEMDSDSLPSRTLDDVEKLSVKR